MKKNIFKLDDSLDGIAFLSLKSIKKINPWVFNFEDENKNSQQLKKLKKTPLKCILILSAIFFTVFVPFFISLIFHIPAKYTYFEAMFSASDLLQFEGTIIGAFFLFITVYITIQNSHKEQALQRINDKIEIFLKSLQIDTQETFEKKDLEKKYNKILMIVKELERNYKDLCFYLPKPYKEYFEQKIFIHLSNIQIKLLEMQQIDIAFRGTDKNNKDYEKIESFVRKYTSNSIDMVDTYLYKTTALANTVLYEIRQSLSNI